MLSQAVNGRKSSKVVVVINVHSAGTGRRERRVQTRSVRNLYGAARVCVNK